MSHVLFVTAGLYCIPAASKQRIRLIMFRSVRDRELLGQRIPARSSHPILTFFRNVSYSSPELLARMTKTHELEGHQGCVNTIHWSKEGDKLLSGSDDTNLCIFKMYENFELATKIETGHKSNIFSAKFLPCTSDVTLVSCAGDREIRIFDIYPQHAAFYSMPKKTRVMTEANGIRHVFSCHRGRVKRLALEDGNPYFFLSCSEDGTVRQFDLREPHSCTSRTRSRSSISNFDDSSSGCPPPLVDYSSTIELNTISLSQLNPNYFAIAGSDPHIFFHDRRMTGPVSSTRSSPSTRCVKRFVNVLQPDASSQSDSDSARRYRTRSHVTAVKISESNGRELLGSWSSDHVYLFDIHDSVTDLNLGTGQPMASSPKIKTNPSGRAEKNTSDTNQLDEKEKFELLRRLALSRARRGEYPSALIAQSHLIHLIRLRNRSVLRDHRPLTVQRIEDFLVHAVLALRMAQNEFTAPDPENVHTHLKQAANDAKEAGSLDPDDWRAAWTSAVTSMLLAVCNFVFPEMAAEISDEEEDSNEETKSIVFYVAEAMSFIEMARNLLLKENSSFDHVLEKEEQEEGDSEEKMSLNKKGEIGAATKKRMIVEIEELEQDLKALKYDAHVVDDPETQDKKEDRKRKREKKGLMDENENENVILKRKREENGKPDEDENLSRIENAPLDTIIELSSTSVFTHRKSDAKLDCERWLKWVNKVRVEYSAKVDEWGREEIETVMISDEGEIERKVGLSGKISTSEESENYEDEMAEDIDSASSSNGAETESGDGEYGIDEAEFSLVTDAGSAESEVEAVYARRSFKGHCNVQTVKDVNFYGRHDEYVVSGSDDGALFIWNKLTGKIVQLLQADGRVVNCIQGHPFYPVIAASGIDNTVKIFSPSSPEPELDPVINPCDPKAYSASSLLWEVGRRTTYNETHRRRDFRDHVITRGMLQALAARLPVGVLNENTDMEEGDEADDGVIGCEMQ